jgi:hypothetical protein
MNQSYMQTQNILSDIYLRLEDNFTLTQDQQVSL